MKVKESLGRKWKKKWKRQLKKKILFRYEFKNIPDRLGFITAFRVSEAHLLA